MMELLIFQEMEVREAVKYSLAGGMALHLHRIIMDESKAPRCFVQAVKRGEDIAHLFDQDRQRVEDFVRRLGVRVVVVEKVGTRFQHIDLCGAPLRRAIMHGRSWRGVPG